MLFNAVHVFNSAIVLQRLLHCLFMRDIELQDNGIRVESYLAKLLFKLLFALKKPLVSTPDLSHFSFLFLVKQSVYAFILLSVYLSDVLKMQPGLQNIIKINYP